MYRTEELQFTLRHTDGKVLTTGTAEELATYFTKLFKLTAGYEADFKPYIVRVHYGKEPKCLVFIGLNNGTQKLAPSDILKLANCQTKVLVTEEVEQPC